MPSVELGLPDLTDSQRERLLRRIGVSDPPVDHAGLVALMRGWLTNIAFQNLDLLASRSNHCRPVTGHSAIERCASGLGGTCHVHALSFVTLLSSMGFEASFAAATINKPDDHLLARVDLGGEVYLCDVGNGQPYLAPWSVSQVTEIAHVGWHMCAEATDRMIRLRRYSPGMTGPKDVYLASSAPKSYGDFQQIIALHHSRPDYGPFMTGLRAVRIFDDRMEALRDQQLTTYTADGFTTRVVLDAALSEVLADVFMLEGLPIEEALEVWRSVRTLGPSK